MTRNYSTTIFGKDFDFELTPEVLAYEMSMEFSNQVITMCAEKDISMTELAELLDISPSTLSEKLNGQNLTLKSMASMALALNCDAKAPELIPLTAQESTVAFSSEMTTNFTPPKAIDIKVDSYGRIPTNHTTRTEIALQKGWHSTPSRKHYAHSPELKEAA